MLTRTQTKSGANRNAGTNARSIGNDRVPPQQQPEDFSKDGPSNELSGQASNVPEPMAQDISKRAYDLWEAEGRPDGRDFDHWIRAESELKGART